MFLSDFSKNDEGSIIHTRNLGEKSGLLFPQARWADVAIHKVDIDDSMFWHLRNDSLEWKLSSTDEQGEIVVGEKNVVCDIKESSHYDYPFRDLGEHRTYFRKRKIPRSKKKNYPVKPITPAQRDKHWKLLERSEMAA